MKKTQNSGQNPSSSAPSGEATQIPTYQGPTLGQYQGPPIMQPTQNPAALYQTSNTPGASPQQTKGASLKGNDNHLKR